MANRGEWVKHNLLLIIGLVLPVLLMVVFMLSTLIPTVVSNPPRYDMVFAIQDYSSSVAAPVNVNLVVKQGVLTAQYTKSPNVNAYGWKKLYLYEAKTQKVRELPFAFPSDSGTMQGMVEQPVEATKGMKLDTTLESPDGYQLSYRGHSNSGGLFGQLLWGGSYNNQACLRKGSQCIKLMGNDNRGYYYPGYVQFIGWVIP
ncbi:hypothetical protein DIZ81_01060 [Legionella taurinensis]|uniref:Uncharacterized protein n=1 Tax=Legionella taurinensis TaxID=70611 RepID=A0A3A5L7M4_9GAMM|nr:hypothetical protein [Legionella taurinensis]MDX1836534.1 hypothetical protein [Legionella taurinensis]PUT43001.1 hypothetical protein DB744_01065 [Legionella taurinensis]PUT45181.1 hypothetical protein DB743_07485 [Legionella taurinensis]PUT45557.1 hypothetical protein DB746_01065 [Legionella taurinensis]PUT49324.1 hypothetical protein DB745_01065 [Legionella taurinensis]